MQECHFEKLKQHPCIVPLCEKFVEPFYRSLALKRQYAELMWVWFCGHCGLEQLQHNQPSSSGDKLTCTLCGLDTLVLPNSENKESTNSTRNKQSVPCPKCGSTMSPLMFCCNEECENSHYQ